jgi:DNA-directed RNA polymerase subunit F
MNVHSNAFTTSTLETAGDTVRALAKRYYVSADEARTTVELLRPQVAKYEKQLNEFKTALREELDRREKLGIKTTNIYPDDETDKYSMLWKERYKTSSLYSNAKSEMLNAEKQLQEYNNRTNGVRP